MNISPENKFLNIKRNLNKLLVHLASKNKFFVSITPVGSHAEAQEMEMINDVDIVFVFDDINRFKWNIVVEELKDFSKKYSNQEIGIIVETRFGPFKTKSEKSITIQIHALFFDIKSFRDYVKTSPLIALDWYRFSPLIGKKLANIASIPFLTATDIIKARGGINYSLEQLNSGMNIAMTFGFDNNGKLTKTIEKIPQSNQQKAEMCYKSVKNILLNIFKLKAQKNIKPNNDEIKYLGKEILGKDNLKIVEKLEKLYKKARTNKKISNKEILLSQEKSREVLLFLKKYLSQYK